MSDNAPDAAQTALQPAGGAITTLPPLPTLPKHLHAIRALGKEGKAELAKTILSHYESGRSMYEMAETLGVSPPTLYRLVTAYDEKEWREVTVARYQAMVDECEEELKTAADTTATTRARERLASARWHLERLHRRIYGQDQAPGSGQGINISINLHRDSTEPPAIDVTPLIDKE